GTPEERKVTPEKRIKQWLTQLSEHRAPKVKEEPEIAVESIKFVKFEKEPVKSVHQEEPLTERRSIPEAIQEEIEEPDLKIQIREAAYFFSLKKYTYDELCWLLSEKIQKINMKLPSIEDIRQKAEEVFRSGCTYDELCWLNAEMEILMKKSFIEIESNRFHY
ncbi:MAG: hypothetical protein ACFFDB_20785, partial [Promethearchaeota archaeon]